MSYRLQTDDSGLSHGHSTGFVVRTAGDAALVIRREWEREVLSSEILTRGLESMKADRTALSGGRGSVSVHTVSGIGKVVLRRYLRGGLIGKFLTDRYFASTRPFRELDALALAHSRGVPVPEVVGSSSIRAGRLFFRCRIVTRLIPHSRTLPVFIGEERGDARRIADILKKAGMAIRKMHDAGIAHADLNMNNILVNKKGAVFIIDFDKATIAAEVGTGARIRNFRRLLRSARKLAGSGLPFSDGDFEAILGGYCGEDERLFEKLYNTTVGSHTAALRGCLSRLIHRFL